MTPRKIKTVILVDDSMSVRALVTPCSEILMSPQMTEGNLWLQAREALGGIVDIANSRGTKGIDLHFMHQEEFYANMRVCTSTEISAWRSFD